MSYTVWYRVEYDEDDRHWHFRAVGEDKAVLVDMPFDTKDEAMHFGKFVLEEGRKSGKGTTIQ